MTGRKDLDKSIVVQLERIDPSSERLKIMEAWLDEAERERAARFHFPEDRARFAFGRGLARRYLSDILSVRDPKLVKFALSDRGRPTLANDESIQFSITHSKELVAVAMTRNARVGIDLECMERKLNLEGLAERILSAEDFRGFEELPEQEKEAAFFRVWTRKESYLKATGEGITDALKEISVSMRAEEVSFIADGRDKAGAKKWRMHSLALPADYMGCVACDDVTKSLNLWPVPCLWR